MSLSTLVMLIGLGILYGALFKLELANYLPHLAVSLIIWQWISTCIIEACSTLTGAEGVIRQMRLPYTLHALRIAFRNSLVAAHSLPLIPIVFLVFGHVPGPEAFLAIFGFLLILVNILAGGLLLGMMCARLREKLGCRATRFGAICAMVMRSGIARGRSVQANWRRLMTTLPSDLRRQRPTGLLGR